MTDRVAPEELVAEFNATIDYLASYLTSEEIAVLRRAAQYITRLEGENERLTALVEQEANRGCRNPRFTGPRYSELDTWKDCGTCFPCRARTALSHSAPKEGT